MTDVPADVPVEMPLEYHEPARGYRSLVWTALTVVLPFLFDLLLNGSHGAVTHLPGWLIAAALLLGVHVLVLYAVRSTHSLTVTADEIAVGDEAVPRADLVAVRIGGGPNDELATLGWPNAFPRGQRAVTLRLADGREVLVPTRFPQRLWASPICTELSPAGGRRRKHAAQLSLLEPSGHVPTAALDCTRATFWDVVRATEVHRYMREHSASKTG